jgi:hypothetical protein
MSGPFKMKNSGLAYSAKHKSPIEYASPVKVDEEEKNEWGETPEQYKKRMEEMGLRKSDAKVEIDNNENKEASKRDKKAAGQ